MSGVNVLGAYVIHCHGAILRASTEQASTICVMGIQGVLDPPGCVFLRFSRDGIVLLLAALSTAWRRDTFGANSLD